MPYPNNSDLPDVVRLGLGPDAQSIVRAFINHQVYEDNVQEGLAVTRAQAVLQEAGWQWNGQRWESIIGKKIAEAVICKVVDDKQLVFGWANVIKDAADNVILDRQEDFVDDDWELEKAAYDYVLNSRDGGAMHIRKGVSTMVESMVFTPEKTAAMGIPNGLVPTGWWAGFRVHDPKDFEKVKNGHWSGFSVHGGGLSKRMKLAGMKHVRPT